MTTEFKNGYAVGLQTGVEVYTEEERINIVDSYKTIDGGMRLICNRDPFVTVDGGMRLICNRDPFVTVDGGMRLICIITEVIDE